MAHVGVIKELSNLGVKFTHVAGTSAGSIIAALYAAGVDWELLEQRIKCLQWHQVFEWNYIWSRRLEGRKLLSLLLEMLGRDTPIETLPIKLFITTVELVEGKNVVLTQGSI